MNAQAHLSLQQLCHSIGISCPALLLIYIEQILVDIMIYTSKLDGVLIALHGICLIADGLIVDTFIIVRLIVVWRHRHKYTIDLMPLCRVAGLDQQQRMIKDRECIIRHSLI